MAKRKSLEVDELLPNDQQLSERTMTWKTFMDTFLAALNQSAVIKCTRNMQAVIGRQCRFCFNVIMHSLLAFRRWLILRERKRKLEPPPETGEPSLHDADSGEPERKYNKTEEVEELLIEQVCDMLDCDVSDQSNASDVKTDAEADNENDETEIDKSVVENQLVEAVAKRKSVWEKSGLLKLMKAVEEMPSNLKVEKWLFNQDIPFDLTENRETIVTQENADGDRMQFSRKQEVIISRDVDDADSLSTVDEKKYILQNTKDRNVTSKIKVIQTFRIKTNNAKTIPSDLKVLTNLPIHDDEIRASVSRLGKSDSVLGTSEDQLRTQVLKTFDKASASRPVEGCSRATTDNRRKKVFKKTVKKKSNLKSPSKKDSSANRTQQYESALLNCETVRKVSTRRIHWKEHSMESSSDESDKELNDNRVSRVLRSSSSVTPEVSPRKLTSRRKATSPRKTVDRELVGTFNSICLSPRKKPISKQQEQPQSPAKQACEGENANTTTLFNRTNINSTINNISVFGNRSMIPDASQGIVVYKPKDIKSDIGTDARVRITSKDLELSKVLKPRHLKSFQKFDYLIHPNSSVLFFPSDSEDDEPLATQTTTTHTDGDLSFDDDDPILTYKPRSSGRLNVMECRHH